jgi:hypothetical protein
MLDDAYLGDALARHYAAHGLPADGGESESWFRVRIGPLTIRLPNPPARKRAVFFHDTNHVLTGYNTLFSDGEMVIAGYELGSGCGRYWIAWLINLGMFALGLVACPRPMFDAFVRGRRSASIYRRSEDRATLSAMTVRDLKTLARLDRPGDAATAGDRLRFTGFAIAGLVPWVVALGAIGVAIRGIAGILS